MNEEENVTNEATEPTVENSQPTETKEESVKAPNEHELTQDVLDKAIASFKSENPNLNWEDVDQDTRWSYLSKAY